MEQSIAINGKWCATVPGICFCYEWRNSCHATSHECTSVQYFYRTTMEDRYQGQNVATLSDTFVTFAMASFNIMSRCMHCVFLQGYNLYAIVHWLSFRHNYVWLPIYNKRGNFLEYILLYRRSIWVLLKLIRRWTQHLTKTDQAKCKIEPISIWKPRNTGFIINIDLHHQYGISVAESQRFLLSKCQKRRGARRNSCFRRLIMPTK